MINIAESKIGTHVVPGLVTGRLKIEFHGPQQELRIIVEEIEKLIRMHNDELTND